MARRWHLVMLLGLVLATPDLRAQEWLLASTNRFAVISQLNERDTRQWTREFNRFIDALHQLLPFNENLLPPLTAVLFRRSGGFSPYRMRTDSGVVGGNTGVFINYSTWSLIGMPGESSSDLTTTYHEAVHWFMSADPARYPLWFREGIAEVFSTFEVQRDTVSWGRPTPNNLDFLESFGLQPMESFLSVSQDEAMHVNATYYPQAWLFMHYLLFGRLEDGPRLLGELLTKSQTMNSRDAFIDTFDESLDEFDQLLRRYSREPRFNVSSTPIDRDDEPDLVIQPAPEAFVEMMLARLAFGTGNDETLMQHVQTLNRIAPDSAELYDLLAAQRLREGNGDIESLLDRAISLDSEDARTYELKATIRAQSSRSNGPRFRQGSYDADDASEIAHYLARSAQLRPTNLNTYSMLADVLFSVDTTDDELNRAVAIGSAVYPKEGVVLIAQAALAGLRGQPEESSRLIDLSLNGDYRLTDQDRDGARLLLSRLTL